MFVTICGRFRSDEGALAGYGNRIRVQYTAKWGVQIAGMVFQTRSNIKKAEFNNLNTFFPQREHKLSLYCELSNEKNIKEFLKEAFYHEE